MRHVVTVFLAWTIGTSTALAQGPETSESLVLPTSETCGRFYAEVELLLRWFKPVCASVPIITIGDPQAPIPGALAQPGTQVVVGGSPPHKFEFPMTPGAQLTVGWDRGDGTTGLEVSGFVMEQATNSQFFVADPKGFPNTYLPYQAPDNSHQAIPFTVPGVVTGSSVAVGSTKIWGIASNVVVPFTVDRGAYAFYGRFLVGGRYLDLTDRVRVTNSLHLVADVSAFAIGADQFSTHNRFAGPQIGTTFGITREMWSVELSTNLAAGLTHQLRNIEGAPLLSASVLSPLLVPGPLLVLPSNVSRETARRVTLIPEISVKCQLALTSWCTISLGYSLLYWNKVLCPGDQMSPYVNITQLSFHGPVSGSLEPKPRFVHTDYFAQGMNCGIQFSY